MSFGEQLDYNIKQPMFIILPPAILSSIHVKILPETIAKNQSSTMYHTYKLQNQYSSQTTFEGKTLLVNGDVGISTLSKQLLGKIPFPISLVAAFIKGKQTLTASLKSLSWLSSFFL